MRRVGILGGTFDPIHQGHLDAGQAARTALGLTALFVVTGGAPPHRRPVASIYHRFAMVALAVVDRDGWLASDIELDLTGPSFTTDTLQRFHALGYAPAELVFVIGADAFAEIESWKDYPAIVDRAHFAVVGRTPIDVKSMPGRLPALASRMVRPEQMAAATTPVIALIDRQTADVSSTAVRARRAAGQSIAGMVPGLVAAHIERHGLYAGPAEAPPDRVREASSAAGRRHG